MNNSARVEHEATTSKISEEQLFYLQQRGISQEDAVSLIINGFWDLGDMIRTMVCTADENEIDKNKIVLRTDYYDAVIDGHLHSMQNIMTEAEIKYIHYAGIFMTYMQALRFISDYLNHENIIQ